MAKENGLASELFVGGYQLSGDIQAVDNISCPAAPLDVTGINKSAYERIIGLRDGMMEMTTFFNTSTGQAHPVLKTLPTTDVHLMYCHKTTLGNPAACLVAKQVNYDGSRAADAGFTFKVQAQGNAYGLEWGEQLTAGLRTDTTATNGTGVAFNTGDAFVQLPGTSGNYVSTPDAAALDIVGDIDIRAKIAMDDWTPAADTSIVSKYTTTGNQRSYSLQVLTTGALNLQWSEDGTAQISKTSTANLSALANGATKWIRATLDVDNGAVGNDVKFYTSDDGTTWTQLGTTVTTAAVTSIFASTAVLELGSRTAGTAGNMAGKIFEAEVLSGIGGTSVAHPVATSSSVTDATPRTWTVNGTAYTSVRTLYGLQAYIQCTAFTGTSVTVKLQESKDNGSTDAWTDVTGGAFTAISAANTTERIATSSSLEVERYLRVVTTGTFTNASFVVAVIKNTAAVSF